MSVGGRYYLGPGGRYCPSVLWVKRAIDRPIVVMPPPVLLALAAASARGASAGN